MAKVLELQFLNQENKTVTVRLDAPIEPVDPVAVNAAMDTVIAQNIFISSGGRYTSKKGARIVDREVSDINLG
ncbi:DUF2922 domain-containing protein [Fictibacillus phosphorivorans]|uniref:DUF2922 domain-containing protein n=1 Tax=Fictibacillus phosphorivorans TaxID=1221500 RepID=UPI002040115B|nr:DUF2922 domain-containing protein [Fictibacillus phosphorivorans]MCM3717638.1 DUF2922 domain-containing protein [Fictibacillus phosphorivorans]MCM3775538.1 DUF2922 domain-containing protein [Fictibacillus phosphorivorans]